MTLPRGFHASSQANPTLDKSNAKLDSANNQLAQNVSLLTIDTDIGTTNTTLTSTNTKLDTLNTTLGTPAQVIGTVTYTHSHQTVTNSSASCLASNGSAKVRIFQNIDATNPITIAFNATAVDSQQIVLFPKTTLILSRSQQNLDTRQVNCIAASGSPVILVSEGV